MSEIMMENYFNQYGKDPVFNRLVNNLKERYTDQGSLDWLHETLCSKIVCVSLWIPATDPTSTHHASDTASLGLIPNIDDVKDKNIKVFNAQMLD